MQPSVPSSISAMGSGAIFLPTDSSYSSGTHRSGRKWPLVILFALLGSLLVLQTRSNEPSKLAFARGRGKPVDRSKLCKQAKPIVPKDYDTLAILEDKEDIIKALSEAIQVRTETYDDLGKYGEDPRWDGIPRLHEHLGKAFPLVHEKLKVTKPGPGLALIYEWEGADPTLKPVLLTAHQDTVPVLNATIDQWKQPPFSGHYDGEWIWGRGATDTKSSLIAILAALEHLLRADVQLQRTVIAGFGSDEEVGGPYGAVLISEYIGEKYGKDSIALLVDEGGGLIETYGRTFAAPAVTEKGSVNIELTVKTLGGHSSVPPPHTGIGLLALAIAEIEANPHDISLSPSSAIYGFLECAAGFAPDLPKHFREDVLRASGGDAQSLKNLPEKFVKLGIDGLSTGLGQGNVIRALLGTTQATDTINGGVKINALPEVVSAKINHRVNVESNGAEVVARLNKVLAPIAQQYNLSLISTDGSEVHRGGSGSIALDDGGRAGNPAPTSPFHPDDPVYGIFAGTARGVWATRKNKLHDDELVVTPFLPNGNTDTRYYWDYTDNIYRFVYRQGGEGAHTINERIQADEVVEATRYFASLILNFDAANNVAVSRG